MNTLIAASDGLPGGFAHANNPVSAPYEGVPGLKLYGDEQIAMLLYPQFTALDLVGPYHFLAGLMGARIHLVTSQAELSPVVSDLGLAVQPTSTMAECPREVAVLFVPGGTTGTLEAARDRPTIEFIGERASRAAYVTSVCTGSLILGVAGLLRGRRATSHWCVRDLLGQIGAIPTNERIVADGNLVTGAGVSVGMDLGVALVARLRGRPYAQASMLTAEYAPEPPIRGGSPERTPDVLRDATRALYAGFVAAAKDLRPLQRADRRSKAAWLPGHARCPGEHGRESIGSRPHSAGRHLS